MTREEAIKTIEDFGKAGGYIFLDGRKGSMPDDDLISLANNCQELLKSKPVAPGGVEVGNGFRKDI